MRGKSQFGNSLLCIIALTAAVALLAAVPAWAQNAVPPTAREAAALPEFAAKLHPATRPAMNKPWAAIRAPGTLGRRQSPSCSSQYSPDCGGGWTYDNGPVNGTTDARFINFGYIVSDSFVADNQYGVPVNGFDIYVWEFAGDSVTSLDWSITSAPNGGTVYGSGRISGSSLTDKFVSTNQFGYDIDKISTYSLNVAVNPGQTYWVNLQNAVSQEGEPVYWDENSGKGCQSNGCPSQAYQSGTGSIASEAFDIGYLSGPPPPPSCFESGGGMQIIRDFTQQEAYPDGLAIDKAGNFYGTTAEGGADNAGLAYELSPKGQGWIFNPLYSFPGGPSGTAPSPVILGPDRALYGTAVGGLDNCDPYCGLVFSLRLAPTACLTASCSWTQSVLYEPTGSNDASDPGSLVFDRAGNLYGTSGGGAYGHGTVFELTPSSSGWSEKVLHSFTGGSDGDGPNSVVVGIDGSLYGSTLHGGTSRGGVIFQLVPSGSRWTEQVLYNFTGGSDGSGPNSLAQDSFGNLYGISGGLGENPYFIVFMLSPSNGGWVFSTLYQSPVYVYGYFYLSGLAIDAAGNIYLGVTFIDFNGPPPPQAWGAVMMRPPGGNFSNLWYSGDYVEFTPSGPLALDASGNVYGTTNDCGQDGYGTVWELTP